MSNAILVLIALATAVLLNFIYKCTFDYNGLTENSREKRSTSVEITHSFETRKKIPCLTQSMLYSLNFSSSSQFSTSFFQGQSKKSELLFACRDGSAVTLVCCSLLPHVRKIEIDEDDDDFVGGSSFLYILLLLHSVVK